MKSIGLKRLVASVAMAALIFPAAAIAYDVSITGQVDQLAMYASDGDKSDVMFGDNDNSSSRVNVTAKQDFGAITAGATIEIEALVNSSASMTIDQHDDGSFAWKQRKIDAFFSGGFGKISLGQGDGAANYTSESDLSGTDLIIMSDVNHTAKSLEWKDSAGNTIIAVGKTRDNFDGLSRNERLRYDTPEFFGITLSSSVTNGGAYELAARYSADFYGKFMLAAGYISTQNRESGGTELNYNQIGGSLSWLMPFGLNITLAAGQQDNLADGATDPVNYYGKIGYKFGKHALAIEYGATQDKGGDDITSSNYGLGYVVSPWKNTQFFAAVRQFMLNLNGADDPDAIIQVMAGTRIKF